MVQTTLGGGKILVSCDGPVTTIVINRPEVRNALDNECARALGAALRAFDADQAARVAVLTGAGGAFCAGADLKQLGAGVDYFPWAGSDDGPLRAALSKPVIAAVEGHACAGGLGVALFCDIRIVDDSASFSAASRQWGCPIGDGATVRLPRLVGQGRALDMLITGRVVGADEALTMGLASRKVARGTTRAEAEKLAHQIAGLPQAALLADRCSVYESFTLDGAAAIAREAQRAHATFGPEAQAGIGRAAQRATGGIRLLRA